MNVIADSGCQSPIMGLDALYRMGLKKKFSGRDEVAGKMVETAAQVRVARNVHETNDARSRHHLSSR